MKITIDAITYDFRKYSPVKKIYLWLEYGRSITYAKKIDYALFIQKKHFMDFI